MDWKRQSHFAIVSGMLVLQAAVGSMAWAEAPTAAQALALTPMQPNVSYDRPTREEVARCTIRAEKQDGVTAWMVRNERGELLRRFADTNGDNVVDLWCYFDGGLESYRDIDSNYNGKADQYRWFQTSGTRWGVDKNEDGRIDLWKVISAPEVAEELVWALKLRDRARFELLLLTPQELAELGFGRQQAERISASLKAAPAAFSKLMAEQKSVTPQSEFVDFYRSRPATIPAGTEGSKKDITVHDNASALVETGDKHDQIFLGTLVSVGNTWKLLDVPTIGGASQAPPGLLMSAAAGSAPDAGAGVAGPPAAMQKYMEELEKLDRDAEKLDPAKRGPITDKRAGVLMRLADDAPDDEMRGEWLRQLADMLSSAIQEGNYPQGFDRLDQLIAKLDKANAEDPMLPYVKFRRMWAEYVDSQSAENADFAKIQEKWLADLEAFAGDYPRSPDSAEALLQLGMNHEFASRVEQARQWYQKLVSDFPKSQQANKASGAVMRLGSVGKPIRLRGQDLRGTPVDLAAQPYRGKVVAVYYWATWYERSKQDMDILRDLYAKYGSRGFEVIGICLDKSPQTMQSFLAQHRYPWRQIHEPGGIDGRLANEMGVMTLPLVILVNQKGDVENANIFVDGLEAELGRLFGTATAQGAARPNR